MEYEDRRVIATPEGVELALPLAGLGSRLMALILDSLIQGVLVIAIVVVAAVLAGGVGATIALAGAALFAYVVYDVAFEVRGGGRTPGKRAVGLRVVQDGGAAVGLRASLIRNVIRLFEGPMLSYLPAMISVLVTRDNQRLGDLAAGTLVIREPRAPESFGRPAPSVPPEAYASWDATAIGAPEEAAVRSFLERRDELRPAARRALAEQIAARLRPLVAGVRPGLDDEAFLEHLAAAKAGARNTDRPREIGH